MGDQRFSSPCRRHWLGRLSDLKQGWGWFLGAPAPQQLSSWTGGGLGMPARQRGPSGSGMSVEQGAG